MLGLRTSDASAARQHLTSAVKVPDLPVSLSGSPFTYKFHKRLAVYRFFAFENEILISRCLISAAGMLSSSSLGGLSSLLGCKQRNKRVSQYEHILTRAIAIMYLLNPQLVVSLHRRHQLVLVLVLVLAYRWRRVHHWLLQAEARRQQQLGFSLSCPAASAIARLVMRHQEIKRGRRSDLGRRAFHPGWGKKIQRSLRS